MGSVQELHGIDIRYSPCSYFDTLFEYSFRFSIPQLLNQLLGINISTDGVLRKERTVYESIHRLDGVEVVDLRFQHISIGIFVVKARGGAVVDGPDWVDAFLLSLTICQQQRV